MPSQQFTIHNSHITTQPLCPSLFALQYRNRKAPSMAFGRSVIRSSAPVFRNAASRVATTEAKAVRSQPFSFPKQNSPLSARIFRSPVELSCCVESLMPLHTATSSALLTSMLSISCRSCLPQGQEKTR